MDLRFINVPKQLIVKPYTPRRQTQSFPHKNKINDYNCRNFKFVYFKFVYEYFKCILIILFLPLFHQMSKVQVLGDNSV